MKKTNQKSSHNQKRKTILFAILISAITVLMIVETVLRPTSSNIKQKSTSLASLSKSSSQTKKISSQDTNTEQDSYTELDTLGLDSTSYSRVPWNRIDYTDKNGTNYARVNLPSYNLSLLLPGSWLMQNKNNTLYVDVGNDGSLNKNMQIAIQERNISNHRPDKIMNDFYGPVICDLKYITSAGEFSPINYIHGDNPEQLYDKNRIAYLNTDNSSDYIEYDTEDHAKHALCNYKQTNKLIATIDTPKDFKVAKDGGLSISPISKFDYFSFYDRGYTISFFAPGKSQNKQLNEICRTVASSVKQYSLSNYSKLSFNTDEQLTNIKCKLPSKIYHDTLVSDGINFCKQNDFTNPYYGYTLSAKDISIPQEDYDVIPYSGPKSIYTADEILAPDIDKYWMASNFVDNQIPNQKDELTAADILTKGVLNYKIEKFKTTQAFGHTGMIYQYTLYMNDIEAKKTITIPTPMHFISYIYDMGNQKVKIINLKYYGESKNQAESVMDQFIKTIQF